MTRTKSLTDLNRELERLKKLFDFGHQLKLLWTSKRDSGKEGEVLDSIIRIYSIDYETALKTLRHEFFHYMASQIVKPYVKLVNSQRQIINLLLKDNEEEAYRKMEEIVDKLCMIPEQYDMILSNSKREVCEGE